MYISRTRIAAAFVTAGKSRSLKRIPEFSGICLYGEPLKFVVFSDHLLLLACLKNTNTFRKMSYLLGKL